MLTALSAPATAMDPRRRRAPIVRRGFACGAAAEAPCAAATPGRAELIAAIRAAEGEPLDRPPFLFKATVALGTAVLAAAGLLALGLAV